MEIKGKRVTAGQSAVYDVLKKYGPLPDHALVPMAQHVSPTHLSSSGIRSRRKELADLKLVRDTGAVAKTSSGRFATVYEIA